MCEESEISTKRRGKKKVDYNEKSADAELAKRIKELEKNKIKTNNIKNKARKSKHQVYLNDKNIGWNFIPSLPPSFRKHSRFSNVLDLEEATIDISTDTLLQESTPFLRKNDHIYMISEPPGEPYYVGRIVCFVCKPEYCSTIEAAKDHIKVFPAKYFQVKMNWYYRPRDIQESTAGVDSRLVYASLHADVCPIYSYRGKCTVHHKSVFLASEDSVHEYLSKPNVFYFDQLFDRYTLKYYEVWATKELLKLDPHSLYLCALNKMYPFVYTEEKYPIEKVIKKYVLGKCIQEDEEWDQRCGHCNEWCEKAQCIRCDECKVPIHLYCLDPPLDRKPSKGVVWVCFGCLKKQGGITIGSKSDEETESNVFDIQTSSLDLEQAAQKYMESKPQRPDYWFHYIGSKMINYLEDLLCPNLNLPYPIKCSRVGPKYQWADCNEEEWIGKPYQTDYLERGSEETSEPLWLFDSSKIASPKLDEYVLKCQEAFPEALQIVPQTCNFIDMILKILVKSHYDTNLAFESCRVEITRASLREPTFTAEEISKFEKAVSEYGSELHPVSKFVETQPMSMIVRFYYYWKKTDRGRSIWGSFKGRKKNKNNMKINTQNISSDTGKKSRERKPAQNYKLQDVDRGKEWKHMDDSSFDSDKISTVKTCFHCMFCEIDYSPMWYRITGGCDDENIKTRMITGVNEKTSTSDKIPYHANKRKEKSPSEEKLDALCIRCARMWRRYGVRWRAPMEVLKILNGKGAVNIQMALEDLLDKSENNNLSSSPRIAREKLVEWELVQDAELIIKQRMLVLHNPERLIRMKRNCMSLHTQLNKLAKRMVEKGAYNEIEMRKYLETFINTRLEIVRRKEKKIYDQKKIHTQDKAMAVCHNVVPVQKLSSSLKRPREETNGEDHVLVTAPCMKNDPSLPTIDKKLYDATQGSISASGDHFIDVTIGKDESKIGEIVIDGNFENIKLSDELHFNLFVGLQNRPFQVRSIETTNNQPNCDESKKKVKSTIKKNLDPSIFQVINESNIPIVSNRHDSLKILEMYYSHNPLYYQWAHGKLPEIDVDLMQNAVQTIQQLKTNLGRKSKSPTFAIDRLEIQGDTAPRDVCCVCLQTFKQDIEDEIICTNCGLNVHPFCYGMKIPKNSRNPEEFSNLKNFEWLCDTCSNDLNPLNSTNYQCCLCNAKEIDHDAAIKKISRAIPDALKITSLGSWSHVICALFNPNLTFGSENTLQPINNVGAVLLQNNGLKCDICNLIGGGIVKCDICNYQFHVTCAQDSPGCTLAFKRVFTTNNEKDNTILHEKGEHFMIKPIIICSHHPASTLSTLSLDYRTTSGQPLIEFYCKHYKSIKSLCGSSVKARSKEYDMLVHHGSPETKPSTHVFDSAKEGQVFAAKCRPLVTLARRCVICSTSFSIYWYGSTCHSCHISKLGKDNSYELQEEETETSNERISPDVARELLNDIESNKLTVNVFDVGVKRGATNSTTTGKGRKKGSKNKRLKENIMHNESFTDQNKEKVDNVSIKVPIVIQNLSNNRREAL